MARRRHHFFRAHASTWLFLGLAPAACPEAMAADYRLSYSGRLAEAGGAPTQGPVDLEVRFFNVASGGVALGDSVAVPGVALTQGYFQISFVLPDTNVNSIFPATGQDTWIEIRDATHGRTFPRQRFANAPYALKVPVNASQLTYNSTGQLELAAPVAVALGGTGAATAASARTNLGLGTLATQNANAVAITGGSVSGASIAAGGAVGVGTSGAACAVATEGQIRYNSTTKKMEYCNATAWQAFPVEAFAVPSGTIAFFTTACPSGWTRYAAMDGRAVVGADASIAGTVGAGLANLGTRTITDVPSHLHSVNPPATTSTGESVAVSGGPSTAWAAAGSNHSVQWGSAHTHVVDIPAFNSAFSGVASVDVTMPYIQLRACQKN